MATTHSRPETRSRVRVWLAGLACGLVMSVPAAPARALGTGELVDVVIQAVEPQLAPAKPLILCLINGKSLDQCVQQELQKQAGSLQQEAASQLPFNPNDNRIQQIIAIVQAASTGQWLEVLNKGGPTVAKIVGCATLPPGVKSVGCPIVEYVVDHNKKLLDQAYAAVQGPDWWALVELLGPQTACNFIPIPEIKSTLCGPLGQALAALADFADGGAKAIGKFLGDVAEVVVDFTEDLAGQSPPMPPEEYYNLYWQPRIHWYLMSALVVPGGGPQGWPTQYENCVAYFDNRKASKATAQKLCGRMRSSAQAHFEATLPAIKAAPAAYLAATLRPQLPRLLITFFEPQPGEQVKLAEKNWPYLQPFDQLYSRCVQELKARIPVPGTLPKYEVNLGKWNSQPDDAWKWACNQAMLAIAQELNGWRMKAGPELLAKMSNFGCKRKVDSGNPKLYLECETFEGYDNCSREITAHGVPGQQRCQAAQQAGGKLAAKVATELGTKRCAQTPGYALIRCTRPWKVAQCLARGMPPDDAPAGQGARLVCELKDDPQFTAAQQQVQQILFKLNGGAGSKTDAIGTAPGQGGAWKPATDDNCRTTWDPLAIRCNSIEVLAAHQVTLPVCPPSDPNRDGADAPCLVQVLGARFMADARAAELAVQRPYRAAPQAGAQPARTPTIAAIGRIRPAVLRIEAESLLGEGQFRLRGGQVVAQPMGGFGPGWGGNAQLFWHGGAVGATLELLVDVPQDGAWVVEINLTRAPDYGQLVFEVDQHRVAVPFDGYAPGVAGPVTVTLGTFAMQQGRRPVSLMITGRNAASTGFLVGVDRILLKPSGG